ncbi:hypothetical protein IE53DRAFT_102488 [Violaceomyces palustris]|uniref:Uncharacterized protein n=1 Tax=Violaceomyces palustris TaxID=1673888 RepID=A0ACD0NX27_9BASI|nr:hypothetical protein IE53DRAFT_102488 [Violaceomyces palustris]
MASCIVRKEKERGGGRRVRPTFGPPPPPPSLPEHCLLSFPLASRLAGFPVVFRLPWKVRHRGGSSPSRVCHGLPPPPFFNPFFPVFATASRLSSRTEAGGKSCWSVVVTCSRPRRSSVEKGKSRNEGWSGRRPSYSRSTATAVVKKGVWHP